MALRMYKVGLPMPGEPGNDPLPKRKAFPGREQEVIRLVERKKVLENELRAHQQGKKNRINEKAHRDELAKVYGQLADAQRRPRRVLGNNLDLGGVFDPPKPPVTRSPPVPTPREQLKDILSPSPRVDKAALRSRQLQAEIKRRAQEAKKQELRRHELSGRRRERPGTVEHAIETIDRALGSQWRSDRLMARRVTEFLQMRGHGRDGVRQEDRDFALDAVRRKLPERLRWKVQARVAEVYGGYRGEAPGDGALESRLGLPYSFIQLAEAMNRPGDFRGRDGVVRIKGLNGKLIRVDKAIKNLERRFGMPAQEFLNQHFAPYIAQSERQKKADRTIARYREAHRQEIEAEEREKNSFKNRVRQGIATGLIKAGETLYEAPNRLPNTLAKVDDLVARAAILSEGLQGEQFKEALNDPALQGLLRDRKQAASIVNSAAQMAASVVAPEVGLALDGVQYGGLGLKRLGALVSGDWRKMEASDQELKENFDVTQGGVGGLTAIASLAGSAGDAIGFGVKAAKGAKAAKTARFTDDAIAATHRLDKTAAAEVGALARALGVEPKKVVDWARKNNLGADDLALVRKGHASALPLAPGKRSPKKNAPSRLSRDELAEERAAVKARMEEVRGTPWGRASEADVRRLRELDAEDVARGGRRPASRVTAADAMASAARRYDELHPERMGKPDPIRASVVRTAGWLAENPLPAAAVRRLPISMRRSFDWLQGRGMVELGSVMPGHGNSGVYRFSAPTPSRAPARSGWGVDQPSGSGRGAPGHTDLEGSWFDTPQGRDPIKEIERVYDAQFPERMGRSDPSRSALVEVARTLAQSPVAVEELRRLPVGHVRALQWMQSRGLLRVDKVRAPDGRVARKARLALDDRPYADGIVERSVENHQVLSADPRRGSVVDDLADEIPHERWDREVRVGGLDTSPNSRYFDEKSANLGDESGWDELREVARFVDNAPSGRKKGDPDPRNSQPIDLGALRDRVVVVDEGSPKVREHLEALSRLSDEVKRFLAEKEVEFFVGDRPARDLPQAIEDGVGFRLGDAGAYVHIEDERAPRRAYIGNGESESISVPLHETGHAVGYRTNAHNTQTFGELHFAFIDDLGDYYGWRKKFVDPVRDPRRMEDLKLAKARRETFAEIFALINYKGLEAAYRQWPAPLVEFVEPYTRGDFRTAKDFMRE